MPGQLVLTLASPVLVFLATVLGLYFTFKGNTKKDKMDEIKFIVDEHHKARIEIKEELIAVKRREEECRQQLERYREAIIRIGENRGANDK